MSAPVQVPGEPGPADAGHPPAGAAEIHHDHRDVSGGWLRPAVFGVMDGLVSNVALVAGVAGSGASPATVAVAGLAGLVGGALSMASGEYVSVRSERELVEAEIAVEQREVAERPEAEMLELAGLYRSRGVDADLARQVAEQLSAEPEQAWRVHVREELGVDPDGLSSPWVAAGASLTAFSVGAAVPLLPYLLGAQTLVLAAVLTVVALALAGALTSRFTSRGVAWSAGRQVLVGGIAAAATFGAGSLLGPLLEAWLA